MRHDTFILLLCCAIALGFTCAVIGIFAVCYALIGNVWLAMLLTLVVGGLIIPIVFKSVDKIK